MAALQDIHYASLALVNASDYDADDSDEEEGRSFLAKENPWLKTHYFEVYGVGRNTPKSKLLAKVTVHVISRSMMRGQFQRLMDGAEHVDDLHVLAPLVFDNNGHLLSKHYEGPDAGSAVFGKEMNRGNFAYIEKLRVIDSNHRGKGLGTWTVENLTARPELKSCNFLFLVPYVQDEERKEGVTDAEFPGLVSGITSFCRKVGYRRVGATPVFAYARGDPSHASRSLLAGDDFDPVPSDEDTSTDEPDGPVPTRRFPVHGAVCVCVSDRKGIGMTDSYRTMLDVLKREYDQDPASLDEEDQHGLTPLYFAVSAKHVLAMRALLALEGAGKRVGKPNRQGFTLLRMMVKNKAEDKKDKVEFFGPGPYGISKEEVELFAECKAILREAGGDPCVSEGCTCGDCLDGWLSSRRKLILETAAALCYDDNQVTMDLLMEFKRGERKTELSLMFIEHVPQRVIRKGVNESFPLGYVQCFKVISELLEASTIPTPETVLRTACDPSAVLSRRVCDYVSQGGKAEYAIDAVVSRAKDEEESDDFEDTYEEYVSLPTCANDTRSWGEIQEILLEGSTVPLAYPHGFI